MDIEKLKKYALLLEKAIQEHRGKSKDVDYLAEYQPLLDAIEDEKKGEIASLRDMGLLDRWLPESDIREFPAFSTILSRFKILLCGWTLPCNGPSDVRWA